MDLNDFEVSNGQSQLQQLMQKFLVLKKKQNLTNELLQKYNDLMKELQRVQSEFTTCKGKLGEITREKNLYTNKAVQVQMENDILKKSNELVRENNEDLKIKLEADKRHIYQLNCKIKEMEEKQEEQEMEFDLQKSGYLDQIKTVKTQLANLKKKNKITKKQAVASIVEDATLQTFEDPILPDLGDVTFNATFPSLEENKYEPAETPMKVETQSSYTQTDGANDDFRDKKPVITESCASQTDEAVNDFPEKKHVVTVPRASQTIDFRDEEPAKVVPRASKTDKKVVRDVFMNTIVTGEIRQKKLCSEKSTLTMNVNMSNYSRCEKCDAKIDTKACEVCRIRFECETNGMFSSIPKALEPFESEEPLEKVENKVFEAAPASLSTSNPAANEKTEKLERRIEILERKVKKVNKAKRTKREQSCCNHHQTPPNYHTGMFPPPYAFQPNAITEFWRSAGLQFPVAEKEKPNLRRSKTKKRKSHFQAQKSKSMKRKKISDEWIVESSMTEDVPDENDESSPSDSLVQNDCDEKNEDASMDDVESSSKVPECEKRSCPVENEELSTVPKHSELIEENVANPADRITLEELDNEIADDRNSHAEKSENADSLLVAPENSTDLDFKLDFEEKVEDKEMVEETSNSSVLQEDDRTKMTSEEGTNENFSKPENSSIIQEPNPEEARTEEKPTQINFNANIDEEETRAEELNHSTISDDPKSPVSSDDSLESSKMSFDDSHESPMSPSCSPPSTESSKSPKLLTMQKKHRIRDLFESSLSPEKPSAKIEQRPPDETSDSSETFVEPKSIKRTRSNDTTLAKNVVPKSPEPSLSSSVFSAEIDQQCPAISDEEKEWPNNKKSRSPPSEENEADQSHSKNIKNKKTVTTKRKLKTNSVQKSILSKLRTMKRKKSMAAKIAINEPCSSKDEEDEEKKKTESPLKVLEPVQEKIKKPEKNKTENPLKVLEPVREKIIKPSALVEEKPGESEKSIGEEKAASVVAIDTIASRVPQKHIAVGPILSTFRRVVKAPKKIENAEPIKKAIEEPPPVIPRTVSDIFENCTQPETLNDKESIDENLVEHESNAKQLRNRSVAIPFVKTVKTEKIAESKKKKRGKTPLSSVQFPLANLNEGEIPSILGRLSEYYSSEESQKKRKLSSPFYVQKMKFVEMQLQRLIDDEQWTSEVHQDVVEKITEACPSNIVACSIIEFVAAKSKDEEPNDKTYTPPAPIMTRTQQKISALIYSLEKTYPDLFRDIQSGIEYKLFRLNNAPESTEVEALTCLFVVLARIKKDRQKVRIFCIDALYCYFLKAAIVMYKVLTSWPEVLPIYGSTNEKLPLCIMHLIMSIRDPGDNFPKMHGLKQLLRHYYKYPYNEHFKPEDFAKECLTALKEEKTDFVSLNTAICLLAKKEGPEWSYRNILHGGLYAMIIHKTHNSMVHAFDLLGSILKAFPIPDEKGVIKTVFEQLSDLLASGGASGEEQESIARALLCLNRHYFNEVAACLLKWTPVKELLPGTQKRLQSMFSLRDRHWWRRFIANGYSMQEKKNCAIKQA